MGFFAVKCLLFDSVTMRHGDHRSLIDTRTLCSTFYSELSLVAQLHIVHPNHTASSEYVKILAASLYPPRIIDDLSLWRLG